MGTTIKQNYKLQPVLDLAQRDAYGGALQIGTKLQIDPKQTKVVREIFDKYIAAASHRAIAADLNAQCAVGRHDVGA